MVLPAAGGGEFCAASVAKAVQSVLYAQPNDRQDPNLRGAFGRQRQLHRRRACQPLLPFEGAVRERLPLVLHASTAAFDSSIDSTGSTAPLDAATRDLL